MKLLTFLLLLCATSAFCADVPADKTNASVATAPAVNATKTVPNGSLWQAAENKTAEPNIFVQPQVKPGDLLTVIVMVESTGTTTSNHSVSKAATNSFTPGVGVLKGLTGVDSKSGYTTNGAGSSVSASKLLDRLAVTVKEVLPTGILKVVGTRTVTMEKDTITIDFSGEVRPQDIGADNTITSTLIANQNLSLKGNGPIAKTKRPGLLSTLFSWIF
ncbi:MAG: flagellar basal body L-ring protein FlgH [bacterium]